MIEVTEEIIDVETVEQESKQPTNNIHPQIVCDRSQIKITGSSTTDSRYGNHWFYFQDGDRIIEVGAIEMINRKLTGSSIHIYINPQNQWETQKISTVSVMIS